MKVKVKEMPSRQRRAKKAVKARLSGAILSNSPKNEKIVFKDDGIDNESEAVENSGVNHSSNEGANNDVGDSRSGDDDDVVEEVSGSAARQSTKRLRDSERESAKESMPKKKRMKKDSVAPASSDESSENDDGIESGGDLFTEDFFKRVDCERANHLQKTKKRQKLKKVQQKRLLGKHTTFTAEDGYKMTETPQKKDHNIEVVASTDNNERQSLMSAATLGMAPSKTAIAFARGSMTCGTSPARGSDSRRRMSKNEETWKRSRKLNALGFGSRSGQAAKLFVRKR